MSAALPPLAAGDGYAKELAKWRARLAEWERTFAIWDLNESHVRPPAPPTTTKKWQAKSKPELMQQREAAYTAATDLQSSLYERWQERNAGRTSKRKARHEEQRVRDWAAERAARELEGEEDAEEEEPEFSSRRWARMFQDCRWGEGDCDCILCRGAKRREEEEQEYWQRLEEEQIERGCRRTAAGRAASSTT